MTEPQRQILWQPHPGPQTEFFECSAFEVLYGGAAGGGKALDVRTPIPTPDGWSTMGDLEVGDVVFADDGSPCSVVACSEVMVGHPCFEVVFSDGTSLVADAGHLWVTSTAAERSAAHRRTSEVRARRRESRGRRGKGKRPDLSAANAARVQVHLPTPAPKPRTTAELAASLRVRSVGRTNHAISVAGPLRLPEVRLPVDPYILGVWLGDGTSRCGSVTTADEEIVRALEEAGFAPRKLSARYAWGTRRLSPLLRELGLLGDKHIPGEYLRASVPQRLALLQGLMDTDGHCDARGQCEFTTTNRQLRDGVLELVNSLGIKAVPTEGRATLRGRDVGPKWRIKFITHWPAFRLRRKSARQKVAGFRGTHNERYIVDVRRTDSVPVRCIRVSAATGCFLAGRAMVPTHNSDGILMNPLRWIHNPRFNAILFRRTFPDLEKSLIPRSHERYPWFGGRYNDNKHVWRFPSGATIWFGSLQYVTDVHAHQSAEYQYIGFDELTLFEEFQFRYMLSRVRTRVGSGLPLRVRAGTNPDVNWVRDRWEPWVRRGPDYTGPRAESGQVLWYRTNEDGSEEYVPPGTPGSLSRTFIRASRHDNPTLEAGYDDRLRQLDPVSRARLLEGDWDVTPAAGRYFKRQWAPIVDVVPERARRVRYWDRAGTEDNPKRKGKGPDWTAGVLMANAGGLWFVEDVVRFRGSPHDVLQQIRRTAEQDGRAVQIGLEQDPGQAGKDQAQATIRALAGFTVRAVPPSGSKIVRFGPFSAQAEGGNVRLKRAAWNGTYQQELEGFPEWAFDDQADATSGAFNALARAGTGRASASTDDLSTRTSY